MRTSKKIQSVMFATCAVFLFGTGGTAQAQDASSEYDMQASRPDIDTSQPDDGGASPLDERANVGLAIAGKVGGGIGKPFSEFGATPLFELEVGYLLPLPDPIGRSLEIFVAGQYAQPGTEGRQTQMDSRLPGDGTFNYEVTQQEATVTLGALYHVDVGTDFFMPYGGLGARMYLLNTKVKGASGEEGFGENEETQVDFGLAAMAGGEFFLGPGAILAELSFGWAQLDGFVMRDTNLGALNLTVGYRLVL